MTVDLASLTLNNTGYKALHDSDDPGYEVCAQEPNAGLVMELGATIEMRTTPPGGCGELMNPNGLYNRVYEDDLGRQWYGTDCPAADVLISGGEDAADGLPKAGETARDRVEALLEESGANLAPPGAVSFQAIPRIGEVWQLAENGDVVVFDWDDDYLIKIVVDEAFECPSALHIWNGVPIAYIKIDSN